MKMTGIQRLGAVLSLATFGITLAAGVLFGESISASKFALNAIIGLLFVSALGWAYFVPRALRSFRKKRAGDSWRIFW